MKMILPGVPLLTPDLNCRIIILYSISVRVLWFTSPFSKFGMLKMSDLLSHGCLGIRKLVFYPLLLLLHEVREVDVSQTVDTHFFSRRFIYPPSIRTRLFAAYFPVGIPDSSHACLHR